MTKRTDALTTLLDAAKRYRPSPEHKEEQRRSFAYGNTSFENARITRRMINEQAEQLAAEENDRRK